jgi:hypothetical protein
VEGAPPVEADRAAPAEASPKIQGLSTGFDF